MMLQFKTKQPHCAVLTILSFVVFIGMLVFLNLQSQIAEAKNPSSPDPKIAEKEENTRAKCLLVVKNKTYMDQQCNFSLLDKDGSFCMGCNESNLKYFVYVSVTEPGVAEASWNATPGSTHAQSLLGVVKKDGACWTNPTVKICAWK